MKIDFIQKGTGNTSLILIFAGWSTGPSLYRDVRMTGWDVAVVHDYSDMSLDTDFLTDSYHTIYLYAWSLGVKVAAYILPPEAITAAFAINGTLSPVDDRFGIPENVYSGTADNLDAANLKKFRLRMSPDKDTFLLLFNSETSKDEIENLRRQLLIIRNLKTHVNPLPWRRAYVSEHDRIFPPLNMIRSWHKEGVETVTIPGSHYVAVAGIVKSTIPDLEVIAENFNDACHSYSGNAIPQRKIASRLAAMTTGLGIKPGGKFLEIGPGVGLFTEMYEPVLLPDSIDFIDIADHHPHAGATHQRFFSEDAEKWMEKSEETYDCILSASAIQWFVNMPRFLSNCHRRLRPGGKLILSSFLPGNLAELDTLRPSPICYHGETSYRQWLSSLFKNIRIESEEISIGFESARQLMMHLRNTGVAGSAPSIGRQLKLSEISKLRTLTYKPIYILAEKES